MGGAACIAAPDVHGRCRRGDDLQGEEVPGALEGKRGAHGVDRAHRPGSESGQLAPRRDGFFLQRAGFDDGQGDRFVTSGAAAPLPTSILYAAPFLICKPLADWHSYLQGKGKHAAPGRAAEEASSTRAPRSCPHYFTHTTDKLDLPTEGTVNVGAFTAYGDKTTVAKRATQFWGGDHRPFRDGDGNPIGDPQTTAEEEKLKTEIGAEDATAGALAETSLRLGVRLDFLLALTFALGLWEWKTWEVWGGALFWRACFSYLLL